MFWIDSTSVANIQAQVLLFIINLMDSIKDQRRGTDNLINLQLLDWSGPEKLNGIK